MSRNRLIAVLVGAAVLVIVLVAGLWRWYVLANPPTASERTLVTALGYCNAEELRPCIVSFSQTVDGDMLVNILVPNRAYPNFYLTISRIAETERYECKKVKDSKDARYCTGQNMYPGEMLQFSLVALTNDQVLANGNFAIIGLLLATPGVETTATVVALEGPAMTEAPIFTLPTQSGLPQPNVTQPSSPSPNPSYPNPSYPNP